MRGLIRNWAIPLSVFLHGTVVAAMVMRFEEAPRPPPADTISLSIPAPAADTLSEAKAPDPITAAPPPPPEMRATEVPPEPVKARPPPSPMAPADQPPLIESRAVEAPVVAAAPPKAVRAKPKPDVVTEKKQEAEAPAVPAPAPETKPAETAMAPSPVVAPPARTEMRSSAAGPAGPPPDFIGRLRAKLERAKVYPRAAQTRRQEGVTHLRFTMDRGGKVLAWSIVRSSGHAALDHEVEAMLQRAQPLPPFPEEMSEQQLELVVPVQFFLRDLR